MKKFSDQSSGIQWSTIGAIIAVITGGLGAAVLWAADARINEKYATDEDVRAVQETTSQQFKSISETVQSNTKFVRQVGDSVDGLTLVVLDIQIEELDDELVDLEAEKANAGVNWSTRDEQDYRAKTVQLSRLRQQRDKLFDRILEQ